MWNGLVESLNFLKEVYEHVDWNCLINFESYCKLYTDISTSRILLCFRLTTDTLLLQLLYTTVQWNMWWLHFKEEAKLSIFGILMFWAWAMKQISFNAEIKCVSTYKPLNSFELNERTLYLRLICHVMEFKMFFYQEKNSLPREDHKWYNTMT
jgi:hypothetical protein